MESIKKLTEELQTLETPEHELIYSNEGSPISQSVPSLLEISLALKDLASPVPPPPPPANAHYNEIHDNSNNAGGEEEEEEIDIVGNDFSFHQPTICRRQPESSRGAFLARSNSPLQNYVEDSGDHVAKDNNEEKVFNQNENYFLKQLNDFHSSQGSGGGDGGPIKVPEFFGTRLDLEELWFEVQKNGGFNKVCAAKKWTSIARDLGMPHNASDAGYRVKKSYMKILLPYEKHLSTNEISPAEKEQAEEEGKCNDEDQGQNRCRVSFAPLTNNKRREEDDDEEICDSEEEAAVEVDVQLATDAATTLATPFSVQQEERDRKRQRRSSAAAEAAAAEVAAKEKELAKIDLDIAEYATKQPQTDKEFEDEVERLIEQENQAREHEELIAATLEFQTVVQYARAVLPLPVPGAGLLAMASMAIHNKESKGQGDNNDHDLDDGNNQVTPREINQVASPSKCLRIAATLIPALAAEISRLEQEKAGVEAPAAAINAAGDLDIATPATNTAAAPVGETIMRHASGLLVSLRGAALRRQQQQVEEQQGKMQLQEQEDDPMDALNAMLGIQ